MIPPIELLARTESRGGRPRAVVSKWNVRIRSRSRLVILIHGYNNDEYTAHQLWQRTHGALSGVLPRKYMKDVALFYWTGDEKLPRSASAAFFPWQIRNAVDSGTHLADFLLHEAREEGLRVVMIAHSLGGRVALAAASELRRRQPHQVELEGLLLMAAAVPEGLCRPGHAYGQRVGARETVLFSTADTILRRFYPVGQRAARLMGLEPETHARGAAVGRMGTPVGRWHGEALQCGLGHSDYWHDQYSINHIEDMMRGRITARLASTRTPASQPPASRTPRARAAANRILPER